MRRRTTQWDWSGSESRRLQRLLWEQLLAAPNQLERNRSQLQLMAEQEKLEKLIISGQPTHQLALAAFSDEQGDD